MGLRKRTMMSTIRSMMPQAEMVWHRAQIPSTRRTPTLSYFALTLPATEVAVDAPKRGKKKKNKKRDMWNATQKCKSLQVRPLKQDAAVALPAS